MIFFRLFLALLLFGGFLIPASRAAESASHMTADELACLQKMIFLNECSERVEKMLTWNDDEAFPSFGIGHFIWYPQNQKGPFKDAFPDFLSFLEAQKVEIPAWIQALPNRGAPWANREEFQKDLESERMKNFKEFLVKTMGLQIQFIMKRIEGVLPKMLEIVPQENRATIEKKFHLVATAPKGMFALIDYVNFKGEGILETERLQGSGWGLLQVLETMRLEETEKDPLEEFVKAATEILEKRVKNSLPKEDRSKRLSGWKKRVKNYLKIRC